MNIFKIDNVDVFLDNKEFGRGKITISDDYGHNFSCYWGAMGDTLEDFIIRINDDYFVNKLGPIGQGPINGKKTVANIRRHLNREGFHYSYPWYKHMEFQKSLREALNELANDDFRDESLYDDLKYMIEYKIDFNSIEDYHEEERVKQELKDNLLQEPWHFIVNDEHRDNIWLSKFHKKLIKELKKQKKLQPVNN